MVWDGFFSPIKFGGYEFITQGNTDAIDKKFISFCFFNIEDLIGKSIGLQEIKDLYINKYAQEKIKKWKKNFERIFIKKLCDENIFNDDMKSLTSKGEEIREKILALKNFISDYSLLNEKNFENYIIWGKYLSYATAIGNCRKIEEMAENYTIQTDDIIDAIKRLAMF